MKRLIFVIALLIGLTTFSKAQSPYQYQQPNQSKPIVKAIDSLQVAGVPINLLVIKNISVSDSSLSVQSALTYSGKSTSTAQLLFLDKFVIVPTTNVNINSVATLVANKRGVRLH